MNQGEKNPTVSIIVPIYNAEKYINRCIDSILNQEYQDFELILANDGSTDRSGEICDEYAQKHSNIVVMHKENSGVSDTRNKGLDIARGTYIQFLDSDDWITTDATKLFVRTAKEHNCDLVISDFYRVAGERISQKGDIEFEGAMNQEQFAKYMVENPADFYYGVLWNKLFRRDIIEKYHLRMDIQISWCEDFMFNLEYLRHCNVIYALQIPIYYYVRTKGSLASQGMSISNTIKMKLLVFEYYNSFYKSVYNEEDYEDKRLQVYRFFLTTAKDGGVPPSILPGSIKLGNERSRAVSDAVLREGIVMETYRSRKLLERYLDTVAVKNDLTMNETLCLLYLCQSEYGYTVREISDLTGLGIAAASHALQKLVKKTFVDQAIDHQTGKKTRYILLPASVSIQNDLSIAQSDFDAVRFDNFSKEELIEFEKLSAKIKENIQKRLLQ